MDFDCICTHGTALDFDCICTHGTALDFDCICTHGTALDFDCICTHGTALLWALIGIDTANGRLHAEGHAFETHWHTSATAFMMQPQRTTISCRKPTTLKQATKADERLGDVGHDAPLTDDNFAIGTVTHHKINQPFSLDLHWCTLRILNLQRAAVSAAPMVCIGGRNAGNVGT